MTALNAGLGRRQSTAALQRPTAPPTNEGGPPTTTPLAPSVTVVSSTVDAGVRTVTLTRPMAGKGPAYFTFPPTSSGAAAARYRP